MVKLPLVRIGRKGENMSSLVIVGSVHSALWLPSEDGEGRGLKGRNSVGRTIEIARSVFLGIAVLLAASASAGEMGRASVPDFVPDEIIVKFRPSSADALHKQLELNNSAVESNLPRDFSVLNRRCKVRKIRPVLRDFRSKHQRMVELRSKSKGLLTPKEKHIMRRLQRAPKNAIVPGLDRIYKIQVALGPGQSLQELAKDLRNDPGVEYAELNYIVSICRTPDDALYPVQWSLNNVGQDYPVSGRFNFPPGTPDSDIDAPRAWDKSTGVSDIIVAVIDSGVDYAHRDLVNNIWVNQEEADGAAGVDDDGNGYIDDVYGYDFAYKDADPNDDHGHGTHCAGIIAAEGNNGLDIAGLCWNARIMAVKFITVDGTATVADAVEAVHYAVDNGADVTSNSWGGFGDANSLREAFDYAYSQGLVMVAAAGNENSDEILSPAGYETAISVAATDSDDERAPFSSYGDWVDIAAPGVDILSLRASGTSMASVYDPFTTISSGTSMACPHVAGACAMLLSIDDEISADELADAMMVTADPIAPGICASGRLNLYGAILRVLGPKGNVWLDSNVYSCSALVEVKLFDTDLSAAGTQEVTLSTDEGDSETVILTETSDVLGIFVGVISTAAGVPNPEDGLLQVADGRIITARYHDVDDGTGNAAVTADAVAADCRIPLVFNIDLDAPGPEPTVTFETDEPTTARILYSQKCGDPAAMSATDAILTTSHTIRLSGVLPETEYFFVITPMDAAGNEGLDDNAGRCYAFTTNRPGPIYVPNEYRTIQGAIDHCWNGGVVWVADGTYTGEGNRDVDFRGKAITVSSVNGPDNCIVDCQGTASDHHQGFVFYSREKLDSVLDGFTIINGYAWYGAAIYCGGTRPTIRNCIIRGNTAEGEGGGLYGCGGVVNNCVFSANTAGGFGGGGLAICFGLVTNCTVIGNTAARAGGLYGCDGLVSNCIIWANRPADSLLHSSSVPLYSCLEAGSDGSGCIDSDPCFVTAGYWDPNNTPDDLSDDFWVEGDYHLRSDSPCIDAGNYTYCMSLPCTDLDGNARSAGTQIDIGCYEAGSSQDTDGDWLPDISEPGYEDKPDRDGDGVPDGLELLRTTDPNVFDPPGQWNLPGDAATIQQALFFSRSGEVITIAPGLYRENIYIGGRDIILTGTRPDDHTVVEMTTISGDTDGLPETANGRVITFLGLESSHCQIRGLTVAGGHVPKGTAGGIWGGGTRANLTDCIIRGNTARNYGGGLDWFNGPITNCVISGNEGGGLFDCDGPITDCTVVDNSGAVFGGGFYDCDGPIRNCVVRGNSARGGGGLAWCWGEIAGCYISSNLAASTGGGLVGCMGPVNNCMVTGNIAGEYGGGLADCNGPITNCTITGNVAGRKGGGIYSQYRFGRTNTELTNCILWDDTAPIGPEIALDTLFWLPPARLAVSYTNVQGDFVLPGYWADANDQNIPVQANDPNAVWVEGDCHLLAGSSCINAGDPNYPPDPDQRDIDGQIRVFDGRVDMGADEFVPPIEVPLRFTPPLLNLRSKGRWLKAHLRLPADVSIEDVDTHIPLLLEPFAIESDYVNALAKRDGLVEIVAAFDRAAFCQVTGYGVQTVTVEGLLTTGQMFYGTGTINIVSNGLRCLAALASHWLDTGCSSPDWCGGADLDQDSTVNFTDFVLFDACCVEIIAR
ncbi:MAG: S8 family serine peptidase [Planctomycetota bacterium]|jgi:subtilisin family serine protease